MEIEVNHRANKKRRLNNDVQELIFSFDKLSIGQNKPKVCEMCQNRKYQHSSRIKSQYWPKMHELIKKITHNQNIGPYNSLLFSIVPVYLFPNFGKPEKCYRDLNKTELKLVFSLALRENLPLTNNWYTFVAGVVTESKLFLTQILDKLFGRPKINRTVNFVESTSKWCHQHTCQHCNRSKSSQDIMCRECSKKRSKAIPMTGRKRTFEEIFSAMNLYVFA